MMRTRSLSTIRPRPWHVLLCVAICCQPHLGRSADFDAAGSTFEELLLHAQRYGTTKEKRENRKKASQELYARGVESLRYLMKNTHLKNDVIFIFDSQLVREHLTDHEAANVLLDFLDAAEEQTRKRATYLLGFCETPEYADRVMPLLDDEDVAGAAARTLGKWKIGAAAPRISGFLYHERERRRVLAANALRDIGEDRDAIDLIAALNDPVFTVRKAASRALSDLGGNVENVLIDELPESRGLAQREMIRILGRLKSRGAINILRTMLDEPDLAQDAADALVRISPVRAEKWIPTR
jgi:hypothetical protein